MNRVILWIFTIERLRHRMSGMISLTLPIAPPDYKQISFGLVSPVEFEEKPGNQQKVGIPITQREDLFRARSHGLQPSDFPPWRGFAEITTIQSEDEVPCSIASLQN